jgi:hypothetical protein
MSDTDRSARPRQLTMAGGFVIGGSIFLVLSVFDTFTNLHSVQMHDQIQKALSSPTGSGLGLSVGQALSLMRVGLMISAACAAAAAVLGVYVFQRNRAARVALTVLAVPILLTSPLTGGLVGALVAAATLMLWSGPARDWFAGRPIRQPEPPAPQSRPGPWEETLPPSGDRNRAGEHDPVPPPAGHDAPTDDGNTAPADVPPRIPPVSSLSTTTTSEQPGTVSGFGQRPTLLPQDATWLPPPYAAVARTAEVPVTVKVACLLTWVFSGVVALLYLGVLVTLVAARQQMVDFVVKTPEWQRSGVNQDVLLPVLWVGCLLFLGWSLGACALAFFTWRRHNWARWLLVASAVAAAVASLFAFPVGLLHLVAATLTVVGLTGAAARAWFAGRSWTPGPPPGSPPGPPSGLPPDSHQWPPPQEEEYPSGPGRAQDHDQVPTPGGKPPVW